MADLTFGTLTNTHTPAVLANIAHKLTEWRHRARQRAELAQLSERDLHDIGITRVDVVFEISKPFWQA
jgi:uncharacterized protein YjiS (DUF1127 family)